MQGLFLLLPLRIGCLPATAGSAPRQSESCVVVYRLADSTLPTCTLSDTAYDQIAYGAMKYARDMGYRIPDDISFVGMDDITATSYFDVPLSSIHVGYEAVCRKICDLIFARIENRHIRMREKISVPVSINIRESLKKLT